MGAAIRFKHVNVPRQQAEQARLKVVQGPDFGAVFVITGARATLGRGEENDIMVSDLKASRRHAEFSAGPAGWQVKDLGSANGLLHNGKATRQAAIKSGDTVTFGETTLEFLAGEAGTMMLVAPPKSMAETEAANAAFEAQKKRAREFGAAPGAAGPAGSRKLVVYAAVAAGLYFALSAEEPPPAKPAKPKKAATAEDLRKYLPGNAPDPQTARTIDQFFRAGFREYMAGNYLRAKGQFETVLQMAPAHPLATLYLENCEKDIKAEVERHLLRGKQGIESGKLKEARGHYEAIQRILFRDQAHPAFIEARDQLEKVNKLLVTGAEDSF